MPRARHTRVCAALATAVVALQFRHEIHGTRPIRSALRASQVKCARHRAASSTPRPEAHAGSHRHHFQDLGSRWKCSTRRSGIVSARSSWASEAIAPSLDPTYFLYDEESLVVFTRSTVAGDHSGPAAISCGSRSRCASALETANRARVSAQFYLRRSKTREPYQKFFATLEQTRFVDRSAGARRNSRRWARPQAVPTPKRRGGNRSSTSSPLVWARSKSKNWRSESR